MSHDAESVDRLLHQLAQLRAELALARAVCDQLQQELREERARGAALRDRVRQLHAANTELAVLRELATDVARWRETGGDPRDLNYILETLEKYHALAP
jgi:hypothetical protein